MKRLSNINESIWSDIQDRSSGKTIRKEDDINHLDIKEFWEYLCNTYKSKSPNRDVIEFPLDDLIIFPFVCNMIEFNTWFQFKESGNEILYVAIPDRTSWLYPNIEDDFELESYPDDEKYVSVFPKDGSELTNSFAITVIDYLLNNSDNKNDNLFIKKERS